MLIVAALINHHHEAERAYHTAKQEYEESKRIKPMGAAGSKSPYTDPKAYRDEWRSERDLEAQWEMAKWAGWGAIATIVGIVILAATLWETSRAAQAAATSANVAEHALIVTQRA